MIVRKLRLQRGWSQEHLATLTGVNVRTIQRLERGAKMSLETRAALAAVFEVDASTFEPGVATVTKTAHISPDEQEAIEYVKGVKEFYTHLSMYLVFAIIFSFAFGIRHPIIFGASSAGV
jgi:transcriptional regulator with XRE-family HTH domain